MKNPINRFACSIFLLCALLLAGCAGKNNDTARDSETGSRTETTADATDNTGGTAGQTGSADNSGTAPDADALRAMYLTDKTGDVLFVGTETGALFTAPVPAELYDADGQKLTPDQIGPGFVLDLYGNNMMLESYPGQYPGVDKMVVVKEGTESDTAPYQDLIDEVCVEPDPSEPPFINAEYQTDTALTTVMLSQGGYTWSYETANGETQSAIADSSHILQWESLVDVVLDHPTDMELLSSHPFRSVQITRWPVDARGTEQYDEGETQEAVEKDGSFRMEQVEPGYVYLIHGVWENGEADFGFYTKKP